jgi:hypothetical protein
MFDDAREHDVLEHIGMIAGMIGVTIVHRKAVLHA